MTLEVFMKYKKLDYIKIIKIAAGASISCIFASLAQLSSPTAAGIITILSIQNTRRETFSLVLKRVISFFIAFAIAICIFASMGYHISSIFVYLLLYAFLCEYFNIQSTLVSNTVLVLHLFLEKSIAPTLLLNELFLLFIGTGCGIFMNLYMPGNATTIRSCQTDLESVFRKALLQISQAVVSKQKLYCEDSYLKELENRLEQLKTQAYENYGNSLLSDEQYFIKYVEMRKHQKELLKNVCHNIHLLDEVPDQAYMISSFIQEISISFHEHNNTQLLTQKLQLLKENLRQQPLPVTRTEFENRALLYRIVYDLEDFIKLKRNFVEELTPKELQRFWNN